MISTHFINFVSDGQFSGSIEVDDQHLRDEFASQLPALERKARTDLTSHSNENSLLGSAQLIAAETGKPSFTGVESRLVRVIIIFQLFKFEKRNYGNRKIRIQKSEEKASFDENNIRDLRSLVDFQR